MFMNTCATENISFSIKCSSVERMMLCVGVFKAAPAVNALMVEAHTATKTESATAAVISLSPDPLPLHYFLPMWRGFC